VTQHSIEKKLAGKHHISLIIELNRQLSLHFVTW